MGPQWCPHGREMAAQALVSRETSPHLHRSAATDPGPRSEELRPTPAPIMRRAPTGAPLTRGVQGSETAAAPPGRLGPLGQSARRPHPLGTAPREERGILRLTAATSGCPQCCAHRWTTLPIKCDLQVLPLQQFEGHKRHGLILTLYAHMSLSVLADMSRGAHNAMLRNRRRGLAAANPLLESSRRQSSRECSALESGTSRPMFSMSRSRSSRFVNSRVTRPFRLPTSMRTGASRRFESRLVRSTT